MFNTKKDRRIVEITIELNISAIDDWLQKGGKFDEIDKIKRDEFGSWGDSITQKYIIDMMPVGKSSNAYFHRKKGLINQNICGIDYLDKVDENIKYLLKQSKVQAIEWSMWRGSLLIMLHKSEGRSIIFATPSLTEVVELESNGKLSNPGGIMNKDEKMKVTVSLNDDGTPKNCLDIWRGSASAQSLGYGNALAHVSFSTLNFEVEY